MEVQITEYIPFTCYVINLKKFPQKLQFMEKQLKDQQIDYQVFPGIDGEIIDSDYLSTRNLQYSVEWVEPHSGRMITLGEIGCALSHYSIYQLCQDSDIEVSLILEDDAHLNPHFQDKLQAILVDLKEVEWDLCYLGRKKMKPDIDTLSALLVKPDYSYWTVGYIINKRGAKKICECGFSQKILTIDEFLPILGRISPYPEYQRLYKDTTFNIVSAKSLLIRPKIDAFQRSSTEISRFPSLITGNKTELLILAVGTSMTPGLTRFIHSCQVYGLNYKILGLNDDWTGGNMAQGMGGGMKVNLLRSALLELEDDQLILFSDSYDVIMAASPAEIKRKFKDFAKPVVFAAERSCWPDTNLKSHYPKTLSIYPYLNSGGFMGTVADINKLLQLPIKDMDDDQLYYTQYFLQHQNEVTLDYTASLFQTLNFSIGDIKINETKGRIENTVYHTMPCQIHGNGDTQIKVQLNSLGNYLSRNWNSTYGYLTPKKTITTEPTVYISIYLKNLLLLEDVLSDLTKLEYTTQNLELHFFGNNILDTRLNAFIAEKRTSYKTILLHLDTGSENKIRDHILASFIETSCEYWLMIDPLCRIHNSSLIRSLMSYNKEIIAPLLPRGAEYYSNFWGSIDATGFYTRSFDYYAIVEGKKKGCWNVPYINHLYLVTRKLASECQGFYSRNFNKSKGHDMAWCENLREKGYFMFVANEEKYGVLVNEENYRQKHVFFDMYQYKGNEDNWAKKYFHPDFYKSIDNWKNLTINEPLHDVIEFPLFNPAFCAELIEISESYNKWSGASFDDSRIGYENVPTNDIHLSEMKLRDNWNAIVLRYIAPLVSDYWSPFKTKGLNISFVVKYIAEKFYDLKPHHDSSTYSIVVTLNTPGVDFQGGGTRFIKEDVIVPGKIGYATIHPGKLTHYHEGLKITSGQRYLFVSFVN